MELRDYQKEALDAILEHKRGLVLLPTGAGKTLIGIALLKYLQKHYDEVEYYVLVPTLALVRQWYTAMVKNDVSLTLGNVMTYKSFISISNRSSSVFGKTTIEHAISGKNIRRVTVIIIDEAHHAHLATKLWEAVVKANPNYLVGFTATPNPFKQYAIPVIFKRSLTDLAKYIANLEIYEVPVTLIGENRESFLFNTNELGKLFEQREIAVKRGDIEKIVTIDLKIQAILATLPTIIALDDNIIGTTINLAVKLYRETKDRILIKTQRHAAAWSIARYIINDLGIPTDQVLVYRGKQDVSKLYEQKWRILIAIKALSEGIDVPDLTYAILSSYDYGNIISMVQTIGRTLRKTPTKNKAVVYILVPNLPQYKKAYQRLLNYIKTAELSK
jgi:superfamily II DNA or RNA helicase